MSIFRKMNRGVGNIFKKGIQEPIGSFFRKEGGLDQFSTVTWSFERITA